MTHPILPLSWRPLFDDVSFCVGKSNTRAFQWIQIETWPHLHVNIYGPDGSGKTHLGALWARKHRGVWLPCPHASFVHAQGRYILDNISHPVNEEEVLLFLEEVHRKKAQCLWLSHVPMHSGNMCPALHSRLTSFLCVEIQEPDDTLLIEVLKKAFRDIGLIACPQVLEFLIKRMERSFSGIRDTVDRIHQYISEHQVNLTIPTVKIALDWKKSLFII